VSRDPSTGELPRVGARLGDYVLESVLGRGGMGAVFVGRHASVGARRAVKVVVGGGDRARARFEREAQALARVEGHDGVVRVHAYGHAAGNDYLVMDLVEGETLEAALARGPLAVGRAVRLVRQVAEALAHVHAAGVVHRDLKPGNVIARARDDAAVLTDFGVARSDDGPRLTASRGVVGSPGYMAPEQIDPRRGALGPPADVFALGALLFELLTGEALFGGGGELEVVARVLHGEVEPPSAVRADVPADLDAVVLRACAREPALRPGAAEVAGALAAWERGDPSPLAAPSGVRRLLVHGRRRARLLGFAAGGLAIVAAALAAGALLDRGAAVERALSEQAAWADATLDPWALGIRGDDCPADAAERSARADRLEALLPRLAGPGRERAEALVEHLEAVARLEAHRRGEDVRVPPTGRLDGRPAPALAVDALVLHDAGRSDAALERLAAGDGLAFPPLRLVELAIRAEADPAGFVDRARGLVADTPAGRLARELAPDALAARAAEVARGPPDVADREAVAADLGALHALAGELGVEPGRLAAAKAAAVEARSEAWAAALAAGAPGGRDAEVVRLLATVLASPPRAEPGPRTEAVLTAHLAALVDATESTRSVDATVGALEHAVRVEALVATEVDPGRPPDPAVRRAAQYLFATHLAGGDAELAVAALRLGTPRSAETLVGDVPPAELAELAARRPGSQAAGFAVALRTGGLADGPGRAARRAALEEAFARPQADLAPAYVAELLLGVGDTLHADGAARRQAGDGEAARALEDRAAAWYRRAREHAVLPQHLFAAYQPLAFYLEGRGRLDDWVALWRDAVAEFRGRLEATESATARYLDNDLRYLARAEANLGWALARTGRAGEGEEAFARAREIARRRGDPDYQGVHAQWVGFLSRLGRHDEALAAVAAAGTEALERSAFAIQAVLAARAAGRPAEARRLREEALRVAPGNAAVVRDALD